MQSDAADFGYCTLTKEEKKQIKDFSSKRWNYSLWLGWIVIVLMNIIFLCFCLASNNAEAKIPKYWVLVKLVYGFAKFDFKNAPLLLIS